MNKTKLLYSLLFVDAFEHSVSVNNSFQSSNRTVTLGCFSWRWCPRPPSSSPPRPPSTASCTATVCRSEFPNVLNCIFEFRLDFYQIQNLPTFADRPVELFPRQRPVRRGGALRCPPVPLVSQSGIQIVNADCIFPQKDFFRLCDPESRRGNDFTYPLLLDSLQHMLNQVK